MKKFVFAIFALLFTLGSPQTASAQDARYFSLGPIFTAGLSTLAGEVAEGWKIKPRFGFTFGVLSEIDISDPISFNLGLAYESRARYVYREANEEEENYTSEIGYLTFTPLFNFRNFLLGFGIRLPMSGTSISKGSAIVNGNTEIPADELKTAIDFKIGGNIPIIETTGGTLNFFVLGGYDLTPAFKKRDTGFDPAQPDGTLHIGLNYLFNAATMK